MEQDTLNPRQRAFVREYLRCGDGAEAAVAAGYAESGAGKKAEELLARADIQRYRRELEQQLFDSIGVSPAWIGRRLVEIVERCMQAVPHMSRNPETKQREPDGVWEFDPAGALRALHELESYLCAMHTEGAAEPEPLEAWLSKQEGGSGL